MPHADTFGEYAAAVERQATITGPPPAPTETSPRTGKPRLNPAFVEWMMMLPPGHVTDHVTTRTHALRILGNGVVPAQAALAMEVMARGI